MISRMAKPEEVRPCLPLPHLPALEMSICLAAEQVPSLAAACVSGAATGSGCCTSLE